MLAALPLFAASVVWAQPAPPQDKTIDAATRTFVLDRALALLNEHYVFPDVAKKMEAAVRRQQKQGAYDSLAGALAFRDRLEGDLLAVSKDKHLRVMYHPDRPARMDRGEPDEKERAEMRAHFARQNFCFEKVERLAGNVGYVDFRCFGQPDLIAETVSAAFTFLGNVNALIVDLRENGGGDPAGIALVSSYLFDKPTHLNDIYFRKENRTDQFWTLPYVPGRRLPGADVYVLTSSRTFSGAEEFAYNLQNLKRAKIIGETTGGGAHPTNGHRINDDFGIAIPFARAINPVTKTNWEGTGVVPDEKTPAAEALLIAHLQALEAQRGKTAEPPRQELDGAVAKARKDLEELRKRP
jgi:hypothetical protein